VYGLYTSVNFTAGNVRPMHSSHLAMPPYWWAYSRPIYCNDSSRMLEPCQVWRYYN